MIAKKGLSNARGRWQTPDSVSVESDSSCQVVYTVESTNIAGILGSSVYYHLQPLSVTVS